jgi:hypothetical protein
MSAQFVGLMLPYFVSTNARMHWGTAVVPLGTSVGQAVALSHAGAQIAPGTPSVVALMSSEEAGLDLHGPENGLEYSVAFGEMAGAGFGSIGAGGWARPETAPGAFLTPVTFS